MVIYWDQKIQAESLGGQIAHVHCEKCEFSYYYLLTRMGRGTGVAPYSLGTTGAAEAAHVMSQTDLRERLENEAETVPCPKCHWISTELVNGYRRSQYRLFNTAAVFVVLVGSASFLIASWYFSIGPVLDRWLVPYCLIGGPLASIALGAALIGLRNWLRSLIQPNRDFATAGKLPFGTPPALIRDDATGKFQLADPSLSNRHSQEKWVEWSFSHKSLPEICCECLGPPTPGREFPCEVTPSHVLKFPRCVDCIRKANWVCTQVGFVSFAVVMLVFAVGLLVLALAPTPFWIVFVAGTLMLMVISWGIGLIWTAPVALGLIDQSRGIAQLRFSNSDYRDAFVNHVARSGPVHAVGLPQFVADPEKPRDSH